MDGTLHGSIATVVDRQNISVANSVVLHCKANCVVKANAAVCKCTGHMYKRVLCVRMHCVCV